MDYDTDTEPHNRAAAEWQREAERLRAQVATLTAEREQLSAEVIRHCKTIDTETAERMADADAYAHDRAEWVSRYATLTRELAQCQRDLAACAEERDLMHTQGGE